MSGDYPLDGQVAWCERVPRWRPLFNWVLAAPLYLWSWLLGGGAVPVVVIGWFAILVTGSLPQSLGDYLVGVLRYRWRVSTYLLGLTDRHPGFRVTAGYLDPGDHPAVFYSARPPHRSRGQVAARLILAVPQMLCVRIASIVALAVLVVAWFAVLLTGRWPRGMRSFAVTWLQWVFRLSGYLYLVVDDYPRVPKDDRAASSPWPEDGSRPAQVPWSAPRPSDLVIPPPPEWAPPQPALTASSTAAGPEQLQVWSQAGPPDMSFWDPPLPLDRTPDPSEVTGPPWPRLVAASGSYRPPRLLRWPIAAGALVYALYLAAVVWSASRTAPPSLPAAFSQPAPSTPATAALGSEMIAAPDGFALSQDSEALNGPMDAAQFDAFVGSKGAAATLHLVAGYSATFDSTGGSDGVAVELFRFENGADAQGFITGTSESSNVVQVDDPAIPGAQLYDSTSAHNGLYLHGVIAAKGDTAMIVDFVGQGRARPPLVDDLAEQQYRRLG